MKLRISTIKDVRRYGSRDKSRYVLSMSKIIFHIQSLY